MSQVINFDNISNLNEKFILSRLSELEIFKYYENNLHIGKVIKSPLRKDRSPSFGLFRTIGGSIRYKDFATGETGNCFEFVKGLFNCNYNKALQIIANDFNITNSITTTKRADNIVEELLNNFEKKIIPIKRRFNIIDYNYWNSFYIPLDYLITDTSYPCKYIYLNNKPNNMILWAEESRNNPIYCFEYNNKHKIYRPLNPIKNGKWLGTTTAYDLLGSNKLSKGELLIITSSMKDRWVLKRLGYTSVSPCSEGVIISKQEIDKLTKLYNKVILFYDNDNAGKEFTNKMIKLYPELTGIFIPDEYKEKDISDFIRAHKIDEAKSLMKKLI